MEAMRHIRRTNKHGASGAPAGSHTEMVAGTGFRSNQRPYVCFWLVFCVLCAVLFPQRAPAHEIPTDIVIQSYLKPGAGEVELLLRVPLEAMRDVDFPLRGPGYINISEAEPFLYDAAEIWLANFVDVYADGQRLADARIEVARLELPSDRSFSEFDTALANAQSAPLDDDVEILRDQAMLDVLIVYPLGSADAGPFGIDPRFGQLGLRTTTVLHFIPEEGVRRVFELSDSPGIVTLDPRWYQAFFRFVDLGVEHILIGIDHILFVLCLIIPFRRLRPLIVIITSFTVAHSITLIASVFGLAPKALWFPPLIETLIALSIVYMAFENIVGSRWERRWMIAFAFGLVHGFGFSFVLSETLQFAGDHLLTSLLAFNLGVELGQLLLIFIAVPLLNLLFRKAVAEKTGTIILSALLAHSGWHWMTDRAADLRAYPFDWPTLNAAFMAATMRWLMLGLIIGLTVWALYHLYRRLAASGTGDASATTGPL